ncbi:hypothetical protein [Pedobacter sp. KBS0701]|uniref:hypothetical protein n=1 Tax=unclassified Pedobacter TaxID=2628915 RepID=UPI00110E3111|nr:hypothetical protein [Pedobacter sp. KBS0701]QDW26110.1 hypothetical protein FFJ24_015320 [Pedobacter sp. KBS0701]
MLRSISKVKVLSVAFFAVMLCFLSCNENRVQQDQKDDKSLKTVHQEKDSKHLFLTYIDSVSKIPLSKLSETGLISLNKAFSGKLPLAIHKSAEDNADKNIIAQVYKNKDTINKIKAGVIFLVPKSITDSLYIGDFTRYFGSLKKEKPTIGVTEQPLPVQINVSTSTSIKLTFNNNEKLDQARVIMVEVLKYN